MRSKITHLFLDIGGVLLTNGWDRGMRKEAAETFGLDYAEMDERHHLTFGTFEDGKLTLDEYLTRTVFYESRPFTRQQFLDFIYSRSRAHPDMLSYIRDLKKRHRLKVATVSNEGRELTLYRIKKFDLSAIVDFFISSCFVHFRKPDEDIWQIALDVAVVEPQHVAYIDDRMLFVEVARTLGIVGIHHQDMPTTRAILAKMGLE